MMEDLMNIERANWLLWTTHNLERLADRVTKICEQTVFIASVKLKELETTKISK